MPAKQKLLVVDDDQDMLDQMSLAFGDEGYEVVTAQSREEAEEILMMGRPALAILDVMMEDRDAGFVLAYQIKKLYPETPVILLSSVMSATGLNFHVNGKEAQSWIRAEVFLDKPVRFEQLREEVARLLRNGISVAAGTHR